MNTAELDFGRWIPVDGSAFIRKSQSVEPAFAEREGELTVSLSPYDVPEAMRGRPDEGGRCFIIDFKYLTPSEPIAEAETDTDLVKIYLGKNSGRIYSIRACTDEGQRNVFSVQLESNVQNALEKLEQEASLDFGPRQRVKVIEDLTRVYVQAHAAATSSATAKLTLVKPSGSD
jgi:hypothetical protein